MNKLLAITVAALLFMVCATSVAHAQGPHESELTLQTGVSSRYVAQDGRSNTRSPVSQSSLLFKAPLGFMAGVWHTTGFDAQTLTDGDDEIVVGAGWHGVTQHFNYEIGVKQFFNYGERGREFIPEAELGHIVIDGGLNRVRPYINLEAPFSYGHWGLEISGGVEHDIRGSSIMFRQRASVQHNTHHAKFDAVTLVTYRAGLVWRIAHTLDDSMRLLVHGPRIHLYMPMHHAIGYHPEHIFGVSIEASWRPATPPTIKKTIVAK